MNWPDIFDLLLTRDLSSAHIVDFNPYAPRTDALLFTYEELRDIFVSSKHPENSRSSSETPEFRVITSRSHPAASRATPQHAHNMMPREALELSAGQSILDFQETWAEQLSQAMKDTSDDEETDWNVSGVGRGDTGNDSEGIEKCSKMMDWGDYITSKSLQAMLHIDLDTELVMNV